MIKIIEGYQTSDGKKFHDQLEAQRHEKRLQVENLLDAYIDKNHLAINTMAVDMFCHGADWEEFKSLIEHMSAAIQSSQME